jgi:hypothetical protein|tara:strand:- start:579 stop:725 length:147 start_codon:yes stop_codon:yes gene_type:complete
MKLTNKELFEYADKQLSKLTDEQRDRVRRYLNYKFKKREKVNPKNIYV